MSTRELVQHNSAKTPRSKTARSVSDAKLDAMLKKAASPDFNKDPVQTLAELAEMTFETLESQDRRICSSPVMGKISEILTSGPKEAWIHGAIIISNLASDEENRSKITKTKLILKGLVNLIEQGGIAAQTEAVLGLTSLAFETETQLRIVNTPRALESVASLLVSEDEDLNQNVCLCLANVCLHPEGRLKVMTTQGVVKSLVTLLLSPNKETNECSARVLANITFQLEDKILAQTHEFMVRSLLKCIRISTLEGRLQCSLALANVTTNAVGARLVSEDPTSKQILSALLKDAKPVRNQAVHILCNIASTLGDAEFVFSLSSVENRLAEMLREDEYPVLLATEAIAQLCSHNAKAQARLCTHGMMEGILDGLRSQQGDTYIASRLVGLLSILTQDHPANKDRLKTFPDLVEQVRAIQAGAGTELLEDVAAAFTSLGIK